MSAIPCRLIMRFPCQCKRIAASHLVVWIGVGLLFFVPTIYDWPSQRFWRLGEWLWVNVTRGDIFLVPVWTVVLLIFGYQRWPLMREALADPTPPSSPRIFPLSLALYLASYRMSSLLGITIALLLAVWGLICVFHAKAKPLLAAPLASLFILIPGIFESLLYPLRIATAHGSALLLYPFLDLHVFGTRMVWESDVVMQLGIADECSGVLALQVMMLLAFLFGINLRLERVGSWLVILTMAGAVSVLLNSVRAAITLFACQQWGYAFGLSLHDTWAGFIAFVPMAWLISFLIQVGHEKGLLK